VKLFLENRQDADVRVEVCSPTEERKEKFGCARKSAKKATGGGPNHPQM